MISRTGVSNTNALNIRSLRGASHFVIATARRSRSRKQSLKDEIASSPSAPRNDTLLRALAMTQGRARNDRGFTLVEVMISVVILGIGLSIVANSYLSALRGINVTQNNIQAQLLAKAKLEALETASLLQNGLTAFSEKNTIKTSGRNYDYSLEITEITQPDYLAKNLVLACLRYSWQEQNATKNAAFSSYYPKHKEEAKAKSL